MNKGLILLALFGLLAIANASYECPHDYWYYHEGECLEAAYDPARGNCKQYGSGYWTGCDYVSLPTVAQCYNTCGYCVNCLFDYGCCVSGTFDNKYPDCVNTCVTISGR